MKITILLAGKGASLGLSFQDAENPGFNTAVQWSPQ